MSYFEISNKKAIYEIIKILQKFRYKNVIYVNLSIYE